MSSTTLYRKHANGIGWWTIEPRYNGLVITHASSMDGQAISHHESIDVGKAGRSMAEQVTSRVTSRINKMLDRGYKYTVEEAMQGTSNQLGLLQPMLAQPIDKCRNPNLRGAVMQKKLDGHRCLITCQDGEVIAYSRKGKRITAPSHILDSLIGVIPEGETIDGELYCHGYSLQTLASWIKRKQPETNNLLFICYDIMRDESYIDRHHMISEMLNPLQHSHIKVLPYEPYIDETHMRNRLHEVRAAKFEGLMLRTADVGYEDGKRSYSLIKVKAFLDKEFRCIDIVRSEKTGYGVAILETSTGTQFRCTCPGTIAEKMHQLHNKHEFIGQWLTVDFAGWTDDGVPFQGTSAAEDGEDFSSRWRIDV